MRRAPDESPAPFFARVNISAEDVRSLSYDTNFDFVEKKVRGEYDKLLKDFEERYGE